MGGAGTCWLDDGSFNVRILRPNDLSRSIHRDSGFFSTHFDNNNTFIKAHPNLLSPTQVCNTPSPFKAIIQSLLQSIRVRMPKFNRPIFTPTHNNGLCRMKTSERYIGRVTLKGLNTRFRLIIPDLDEFIIACGNEVGFITTVIVVDVVDPLIVGVKGEIGSRGCEGPDFDGSIETRGSKGVRVLGVDGEGHNIMGVPLKSTDTFPILIPVPKFDCHIVGTCKHERLSWMNRNASNVTKQINYTPLAKWITLDEPQKL